MIRRPPRSARFPYTTLFRTTSTGSWRTMSWMTIANYLAANWLESAGFVTTLVGIWLTTRRLLVCWPVVLAADLIYLLVFYRTRLFSDALLQVFFVAFTLYGWWHWFHSTLLGIAQPIDLWLATPIACPLSTASSTCRT